MPSQLSNYYYQIIQDQLLVWNGMTLEERRKSYEEVSIQRGNFSKHVEIPATQIGNVTGDWLIPYQQQSDGIIIHLHGGAFAVGNALSHRAIGSHLAEYSGSRVLMLNYRLCPEHQFPDALDDVVETTLALRKNNPAQKIALSGDSAGGNLALTAALYLQEHQHQLPNAIGLMCPWTDLTMSNATHQTKAKVDPYFPNSDRLIASAKTYAGSTEIVNPLISPQFAQYSDFPPVMIHVGEYEVLLDDASKLHQQLKQGSCESHLEVFPAMWHVWQHFVGLLPEATQSVEKMAQFLKLNLS